MHLSGRWKNSPALRAVYFKTPIQKQNTVINLKECISDDVHSFYYNKPAREADGVCCFKRNCKVSLTINVKCTILLYVKHAIHFKRAGITDPEITAQGVSESIGAPQAVEWEKQKGRNFMQTRIAQYRKERKVTQEELADAVNVTRQTIISLENGKYKASLVLAHKIAQFFGVAIEEMFIFDREDENL